MAYLALPRDVAPQRLHYVRQELEHRALVAHLCARVEWHHGT